jgi:subtilisin family serine protease
MATPFVAGLAALFAQAEEGLAGAALAARTVEGARSLPLPASDVGAGLAQAPS